jgi:nucleotide-binding universal stress UspA family protein
VTAAHVPVDAVLADANLRRVADVITDESLTWLADVIVMGTHGHRGFSRLFLGSDAEGVIRMSAAPVLLVKSISN